MPGRAVSTTNSRRPSGGRHVPRPQAAAGRPGRSGAADLRRAGDGRPLRSAPNGRRSQSAVREAGGTQVAIRNRQPRAALPFELPDALDQRCVVPPHPDLEAKIRESVRKASGKLADLVPAEALQLPPASRPGLNDGLIIPGSSLPDGNPGRARPERRRRPRAAARDRARGRRAGRLQRQGDDPDGGPLQRPVLLDGCHPHGERPRVLPGGHERVWSSSRARSWARTGCPTRSPTMRTTAPALGPAPNARDMARDAVVAADAAVNFGPFDNDGNGFVDAFIVIHAGPGGEVTGRKGDIWSHKWVAVGLRVRHGRGPGLSATSPCPRTRRSASAPTSSATSCSASRTCTTPTTRRPASATGA